MSQDYSEVGDVETEKPSLFWVPFGSFFLPGLSQYIDGDYDEGLAYTGTGIAGIRYFNYSLNKLIDESTAEEIKAELDKGMTSKNSRIRNANIGMQFYMGAGGFSAYSGFRNRVDHYYKEDFSFLTRDESVGDILLAPFEFSHLKKTTTWIPLLVGGIAAAIDMSLTEEELNEAGFKSSTFTSEDAFYSGVYSFGAGTYEEALFRGWLMPAMRHYTGSDIYANLISTGVFAAAHLGSVEIPVAQMALGYYLGYVSQLRGWTLSESVFIHTWWDVLAFTALYHSEQTGNASKIPFLLPSLNLHF